MICGPIRPVSAFSVASTSPVTRTQPSSETAPAGPVRLTAWLNWRAGTRCRDGTADVWWARRTDASDRLAACSTRPSGGAGRLRRPEDRERFLVGCALAKAALARYTGRSPADVRFDRTCARCGQSHGRPVIAGGGPGHSVAHSGDLIAVAVAGAPVGVDVEQAEERRHLLGGDGDPEALARLVLSEAERAVLAAVPPGDRARAFLVAWTRKEAVTKATGDGMSVAFSEVVVAADGGPPRVTAWPYPRSPGTCPCATWTRPPGTWRRSRSSAAARRCGPGMVRRCWPT